MYQRLVAEFIENPRDVHSIPVSSKPYTWFYVFVEKGSLYVESAHNNLPASNVKRRKLQESECNEILSIYHRRMAGEHVSREAQQSTRSQVYWYGIFSEMKV